MKANSVQVKLGICPSSRKNEVKESKLHENNGDHFIKNTRKKQKFTIFLQFYPQYLWHLHLHVHGGGQFPHCRTCNPKLQIFSLMIPWMFMLVGDVFVLTFQNILCHKWFLIKFFNTGNFHLQRVSISFLEFSTYAKNTHVHSISFISET